MTSSEVTQLPKGVRRKVSGGTITVSGGTITVAQWEEAYVKAEEELERAYGQLGRLQEAAGLVLDDAVPIDGSRRSHVLDYSLDSLKEALEESRAR